MKKPLAALCLALLLFSCDDKDAMSETTNEPVNPFVGTWESDNGYRDVFTADTITVYDTSGNIYWKATYTYDDTYVTINLDTAVSHQELVEAWGENFLAPYIFADGYLYFNIVRFTKITS
jgi:hypothetical protein